MSLWFVVSSALSGAPALAQAEAHTDTRGQRVFLPAVFNQESTAQQTTEAVTSATAYGTSIGLLRTFTGNVDYTVIGSSASTSETSCNDGGATSALLTLPSGATVIAAYLYWAGSAADNTSSSADNTVTFNNQSVIAQQIWTERIYVGWGGSSNYADYFGARADVTSQVTGSGSYSLGNLTVFTGEPNCSLYSIVENWSLVVVYSKATLPSTTITLYDGFIGEWMGLNATSTQTTLTHTLGGLSVPTGCTVNAQLTHIAHDGDYYKGEYLYINNSYVGDNTYNGSSGPNLDIDTYTISAWVPNGSTAVTFKTQNYNGGNTQELYLNHAFVVKYQNCATPSTATATPTPSGFCPGNLITNPSFENGTTGWSWSNNFYTDSGYQVDGSYNAYVTGPNGASSGLWQQVNLGTDVAGRTYRVAFYGGTHEPNYSHSAHLDFYDLNGNYLGSSATVEVDRDVDISPYALQQAIVSEVAPATTRQVRIMFTSTGDFFKLDAICLQDMTTLPTATPTYTPVAPTATPTPIGGCPTISGLMAGYSFGEGTGSTVTDLSGNGNGGTITNATWTVNGKFGNALNFNGVNSWVTINDANSLDLTNQMTLEAWVYPTSLSGWRTVIIKQTASYLAYSLYANNPSNLPVAEIVSNSTVVARGASQLPLNSWSHLAATYDGSTVRFYVNGVQSGVKAVSGNLQSSREVLRIGGNSLWGEYFQGRIDEVRIYNRVLNQSEIQRDMSTPLCSGTTPTSTPTHTPISPTATSTNTPVPPTATLTSTPTNTPVPPTATPTATSTNTPVPPTATPTNTPLPPTATPTNTPAPPTPTPLSAAIGDKVWQDSNADGLQDIGEPGVPNVTVRLLSSGGALLITTTTDDNGAYSFSNLTAGSYMIEFEEPAGMLFTTPDVGTDDTIDSDAALDSGRTEIIILAPGQNNDTVDAGLIQERGIIGGKVWQDLNSNGLQDGSTPGPDEPGVPNVTVHLLNSNGGLVAITTSDETGTYFFFDVPPGDYFVEFVKPANTFFTLQDQGVDDMLDSDADPTTGRTDLISLSPSEINDTVAGGLIQSASTSAGR